MNKIKVLPEHVANRIAAGEVVERPASIVKELIENSLDAGAKHLEIAIRHGGKSLIRITDDGEGMSREDAETAFLRHATSKISRAEDIDLVNSFGFRGEALPSIAAVSRTKLTTRARGEDSGTEIVIEGGKTVSISDCSCREGTTIEIRDLFFNTPARRKFMRADVTETGHVFDIISNMAIARLDVQFHYKSADKTVFHLMQGESILKRAESVLGKKTAGELLEIDAESQGVRIRGLVGKPAVARSNRMGQTFFVNGRCVKVTGISYAVQEAFRGYLMHGQFPVVVLFLDIDPSRVDVNVHPTKQEVRISGDAQLKAFIKKSIAERLVEDQDLTPQVRVPQEIVHSKPTRDFFKPSGKPVYEELLPELKDIGAAYTHAEQGEKLTEAIAITDQLKVTKILGQVHHTFILAETEEGMIIVDQHAAHERVHFEALLKVLREEQPVTQTLLMEEVLELSPKHARIIKEQLGLLEKLGFQLDEFGKDSFVIRGVPSILREESATRAISTFLEEKEEGALGTSLENHDAEVAALLACKTKSVRAHDPLSKEALQSLLEQLSNCENPYSCPHGRPSILKYSFEDLEKQFKRKL